MMDLILDNRNFLFGRSHFFSSEEAPKKFFGAAPSLNIFTHQTCKNILNKIAMTGIRKKSCSIVYILMEVFPFL
jgi:hypothetical protein